MWQVQNEHQKDLSCRLPEAKNSEHPPPTAYIDGKSEFLNSADLPPNGEAPSEKLGKNEHIMLRRRRSPTNNNEVEGEQMLDANLCMPSDAWVGTWPESEITGGYDFTPKHFYKEMLPVLKLLRYFGFYPTYLEGNFCGNLENPGTLRPWLIKVYSGALVCFNLGLIGFNAFIMYAFAQFFGVLHVQTLTTMLTALKPVESAVNLLIFALSIGRHNLLLHQMSCVEKMFRSNNYYEVPKWARGRIAIFVVSVSLFLGIFILRLIQYILMDSRVLSDPFSDLSLFFVPLLSLWQFIPVFYFIFICKILRFWFAELNRQMLIERNYSGPRIQFYYNRYTQITNACAAVGDFLNPFFFFSLMIAVLTLCLTIYFVINAEIALSMSPNATRTEVVVTYFLPVWAGLQIATAVIYLFCILIAGLKTNEEARSILNTVLSFAPCDELGRFQIICFTHKIQVQFTWGLTIWRTFPVERGLLFTLLSMIATYAVLLLKLQENFGPCGKTNSTGMIS